MYTYKTTVRYEDLDSEGFVTPTAILNYLQNTAISHAASVGYDFYTMKEQGIAWVIMCWHVKLGRRIRWNENLTVQTWPYSFRGSIGKRCFKVLAEDGEVLAEADSWWALIHLADQSMAEVSPEMAAAYNPDGQAPFTLRRPRGKAEITEEAFPVHRFDIDTNEHVNNSRFAEMAFAYVPNLAKVKEFMVEYKHSGYLGEMIVTSHASNDDGVYVCLSRQSDDQIYIKMQVKYE